LGRIECKRIHIGEWMFIGEVTSHVQLCNFRTPDRSRVREARHALQTEISEQLHLSAMMRSLKSHCVPASHHSCDEVTLLFWRYDRVTGSRALPTCINKDEICPTNHQ
jgi:hypothetical protein